MPQTFPNRVTRKQWDSPPPRLALQKLIGTSPFAASTPPACHIPVHDMRALDCYAPLLPVFGDEGIVRHVRAYADRHEEYRTNPKLQAGDLVVLLEHATVSGYWFDPDTMCKGQWDNHVVLAGSLGTVVTARTPWVTAPDDKPRFFANVDVQMPDGSLSRVRVAHTALRRLPQPDKTAKPA